MKKTIKDFDIDNKRVIIRCDFNVPIKDGVIEDDNRIINSIPTIKYAVDNNAKVILLSHLGRIKNEEDKKHNSLMPVAKRLEELLGKRIKFISETRGRAVEIEINKMNKKDVVLLENTRFEDYPDKKESSNDKELGTYWASLGDIFINDAFGTVHRSHASNVGIASNIPSGIGFLIEKEIKMLGSVLNEPKRPYTVILGGAKMNDKIKVINNLIEKCDYLLLGGGIANTFLVAKGYDLKKSVYDKESLDYAKELLDKYNDKIILPVDGYGTYEFKDSKNKEYFLLNDLKDDIIVLDIGEKTIELYDKYIRKSKTIFLNGPVGVFEFDNFSYGTKELLKRLHAHNINVIVGGGDSAFAAIKFGYKNKFTHISTGGGASLEYIEGKKLPGIEIIDNK